MKLSKNILILFGSYLGAFVLVCCIAQFTVSMGTKGSVGREEDAILVNGALNSDTDTGADETGKDSNDSMLSGSTENGNDSAQTENGSDTAAGGIPQDPDGDDALHENLPVYYLRTLQNEEGASSNVIGVYDESGTLLEVLGTPAFALPAEDRVLLEAGLEVIGDEALEAILQDYGAQ